MCLRLVRRGATLFALLAVMAPATVLAQGGLLGRVKKRVEENVSRQTDRAVDCAMGDQSCIEKAKAEGKPVHIDSTRTAPSAAAPSGAGSESGGVVSGGMGGSA